MRIAIINITGGGMSGGYRKYLSNIIPRMAEDPRVSALLCALPESIDNMVFNGRKGKVEVIKIKPLSPVMRNSCNDLERQLGIFSPDVIFIPVERFFRFGSVPVVNMIQNMEPFVFKSDADPVREKVKNVLRTISARKSIKHATRIIAISNFVRDFLINQWDVDPAKIGLVYHGVHTQADSKFRRPRTIPKEWKRGFLFAAGSIRPARGLEDVIYAMKLLAQKDNAQRLVIAGESASDMIPYHNRLRKWISDNQLSQKICWAGPLSQPEMSWCYRRCFAFIMTSRVEACPNIALEAMSHGCICISSTVPPMPELFRDAAFYYNAGNAESLSNEVQMISKLDRACLAEMSMKAVKYAGALSWDKTAERTVSELLTAVRKVGAA